MEATIYHNPRCSKSRRALELIRARGIEPTVVRYLEQPPDHDEVERLLALLGREPRDIMRRGEAAWREWNLDDPGLDRAALVDAIVQHPILLERPIVVAGGKAVIGRPPEAVLEIL